MPAADARAVDLATYATGIAGFLLAQLVRRSNRRSFAARVHSTRLLSVRIDQLIAEKERLDYERRMASSRLPRSRAASLRSSGRRRQKAARQSGAPGTSDSNGGSQLVYGAALFAELVRHQGMFQSYSEYSASRAPEAQEEDASVPPADGETRDEPSWDDGGSEGSAPADASTASSCGEEWMRELDLSDHLDPSDAAQLEGRGEQESLAPTSIRDPLALV